MLSETMFHVLLKPQMERMFSEYTHENTNARCVAVNVYCFLFNV